MHGIAGFLPGGEVALRVAAIGGCNLQIVIVVDVARGAGNVGVAVCEQKPGRAVIEGRAQPAVKLVATLAIAGRKGRPRTGVDRVGRVLPILQVARLACGG